MIARVLQAYAGNFYLEYHRWSRLFSASGVRVHVSSCDVFPESEAQRAALADLGGVSISLQRSIEREPDPYVHRRTVTDVHFAFSQAQAEREQLSGSRVRQFITAGYPLDDAFPAASTCAQGLRAQLRTQGVVFSVCFFDENHGIHRKWHGGTRQIQADYRFLCDRLLEDPTLGLILKPKHRGSLPQRLGLVWPRVQRLIDDGRCLLLDGPSLDERYLPCVAALASDVAISLAGGSTAGLEGFLAGTRTLLIRHGVRPGIFGCLPGSVLFETWEELWKAVERLRDNPSDRQTGNWAPIVENLASCRDGQSAQRIQAYITWLYHALATGKTREEAMDDAGRRYAAAWGADLVAEITRPLMAVGSSVIRWPFPGAKGGAAEGSEGMAQTASAHR